MKKVKREIERRNGEVHKFYEGSVGEIIRRARIELNLTQETVAKGICSNTYISKLENNQIIANRYCLGLIMERVKVPYSVIDLPKQMISDLTKALQYYIRHDVEQYKELVECHAKYDFGVIIQIIRFGYAILSEEIEVATQMNRELYHYFSSMDDYAFSVFLLFSVDFHHLNQDYKEAKFILDLSQNFHHLGKLMVSYMHYQQFLNYGFLHEFATSTKHQTVARGHFILEENTYRIHHMDMMAVLFGIYESGRLNHTISPSIIEMFPKRERDMYYMMIAQFSDNLERDLAMIDDESHLKDEKHYLQCKALYQQKRMEEYQVAKGVFLASQKNTVHNPDYYQLLILQEENRLQEEKELLLDEFIPQALMTQNIWKIQKLFRRVSQISFETKRYKDAAMYLTMINSEIESIRTIKKTDPEGPVEFTPQVESHYALD